MKYRTIFISDVHMGLKYLRVNELLEFLKENECDTLYLVGDIIDGWALKRKWFWNNQYNLLLQKFLRKSRKGTRIVYLIGNHDDFLRNFELPIHFGNIEICEEAIHITVTGKKYLVVHGDKFDGILNSAKWVSKLGSFLYSLILLFNGILNFVRRKVGMRYWSLSHFVKSKTKEALKFITNFESLLVFEAKRQNVNGVICGHIHHARNTVVDGIEYWNCGSWVEKCHAIVEHLDGKLEIIEIK